MKLAAAAEVPPGQTRFVRVGRVPIILVNYQGGIYAYHGLCPHRGNPLEGAVLWDNLLDCPFHHFQFDVRTGENYFPQNVYPKDIPHLQRQTHPLRPYAVELRNGEIWVNLE